MTEKHRFVLLLADQPTRNKHIYPRAVLEAAVADYEKRVTEGKAGYGQFYTDEWPRPEHATVNLAQVSHRVTNLSINPMGELIGEVEVLNTPMGQVLEPLITGGKARFAPTGVGTVADDGTVSGYQIVTVDVVDSSKDPQ
jgi:hypothetical protein